ncbi:MAG: divergent polysaccharide deacetylase family protein [Paracoccaceae bacterium]|jgi:hypothetical protein|nr:divergent polysaccharide deacetylase family protein [Paracoccaceae bacterium]
MVRSILAGFGAGAAFTAAVLVAVSLALPPPPERGPTPRIVAAAPPAEPAAVERPTEAAPGPPDGRTADPVPLRQADADGGPDVAAPVPGWSAAAPGATPAAPSESVAVGAPAADPAPEVASAAPPPPAPLPSADGLPPAPSSAGRVASVEPGGAQSRLQTAAGRQAPTLAEGAPSGRRMPAAPTAPIAEGDAPGAGAEGAARPGETTAAGTTTDAGVDTAMDGRTAGEDAASAPRPESRPAESSSASSGTDRATVAASRAAPIDARPASGQAAHDGAGTPDGVRGAAAERTAADTVSGLAQERAATADEIVRAGRTGARPGGAQPARGERTAALAAEAGAAPLARDRSPALPLVRRPGVDAPESSSLLAAPPEDGGARRLVPSTREAAGAESAAPGPTDTAERVGLGEAGLWRVRATDVVSGAELARRLVRRPDLTAAARPVPRQPRALAGPPARAPGAAASTAADPVSQGDATGSRLAAGGRGIGLVRAAHVAPTGPARRLAVGRIRAEAVLSAGERPRISATADRVAPARGGRRAGEAPAVTPGPADVPVARPEGEELPLHDGYEALRPTPEAPDTRLAQASGPDDRRAAPGGGSASVGPAAEESGPDRPEPGAANGAAPDAGRGESAGGERPAGDDGGGGDAMPAARGEANDRAERPSVRILRPAPPSDEESAAPRLPGSGSIAPIVGSGESAPADTAQDPGAPPTVEPGAGGALARNAMQFDAPEGQPLLGIVLRHVEGLSPSTVAALGLPLTVALAPDAPDAAELAEAYRAAGLEVILAGLGLPAGAAPQDVEVTVAGRLSAFPGAIGVMDAGEDGFAGDTAQAAQVGGILAEGGHGLLLWDEGLNSALGAAREAGAIAGLVWRRVDRDGMSAPAIGRRIDRAVFEAVRTGAVVVVADGRSETLEALAAFAAEAGQARAAPAPASAVLLRGE